MQKRIYKYPLDIVDEQYVSMPKGAIILSVDEQNDGLFLWATVDVSNPTKKKKILIRGTGNPYESKEEEEFIGTVVMSNGVFVWHVFEEFVWHTSKEK